MVDKKFIFLAGLHRSGTSLLHEIIREHPEVSGFSNTNVPEDEGQHLQTIYEPAKSFGGPGKFAFNQMAYMDESHPLATNKYAEAIFTQWSGYYDLSSNYLIEKSPPNLIRTRYLQKLFPNSKFIIILRHPIAVAYATQKWSSTSIKSLIEHSIRAYEIFLEDFEYLYTVYIIRYEEFVSEPQKTVDSIFKFLNLDSIEIHHQVKKDINEKYFSMWKHSRKDLFNKILFRVTPKLEKRANKIGYSIKDYAKQVELSWLGAHNKIKTINQKEIQITYGEHNKLPIHFLHISKTGGTAIKYAIRQHPATEQYIIHLHPHNFRLSHVPIGEKVIFFLRDPISRFVSGFYSRQRQGQPRYFSPWSTNEKIAFEKFDTPNQLALALSSINIEERQCAQFAMKHIQHIKDPYWNWFGNEDYFKSRLSDILFIGFQEQLKEDFKVLKSIIGLSHNTELPTDDVQAHRNPKQLNGTMENMAVTNLKIWYKNDYTFISLCKQFIEDHYFSQI